MRDRRQTQDRSRCILGGACRQECNAKNPCTGRLWPSKSKSLQKRRAGIHVHFVVLSIQKHVSLSPPGRSKQARRPAGREGCLPSVPLGRRPIVRTRERARAPTAGRQPRGQPPGEQRRLASVLIEDLVRVLEDGVDGASLQTGVGHVGARVLAHNRWAARGFVSRAGGGGWGIEGRPYAKHMARLLVLMRLMCECSWTRCRCWRCKVRLCLASAYALQYYVPAREHGGWRSLDREGR